jgi:hypothetical protein
MAGTEQDPIQLRRGSKVHIDFSFGYVRIVCKVQRWAMSANRNSANSWTHSATAIRQFLRYFSSEIRKFFSIIPKL